MTAILRLENIHKSFGGVQALKGVDFELYPREIHAVVGENGAGKSTLIKIISGVYSPDVGKIIFENREVTIENPRIAQALGIATVYQEPNLYPDLSVLENLFSGRFLKRGFLLDWEEMRQRAKEVLSLLAVDLVLQAPLKRLSRAQTQLVQIARALLARARVLILDEATAALSPEETKRLFEILEKLRNQGVGIIYISHRLEEIFRLADRVTVLRDGEVVGRTKVRDISVNRLVQLMVGREIRDLYPRTPRTPGRTLLEVRNLSRRGVFEEITFEVKEGEIVALAGLVGSGRSEVARAIYGLDARDKGQVFLEGQQIPPRPWNALRAGLILLPEDRTRQGGILSFPISWNIGFSIIDYLRNRWWTIDERREHSLAKEMIQLLDVRPPKPELTLGSLSGGNQQKVVLGRCLLVRPKVLILDEPTQGVDVGAKAEIHRLMDRLVGEGMGILLVSSDLPEVLGMADRILVLHRGRLVAHLPRGSSPEDIIKAATGLAEAPHVR
jgi:rhamnose transport system ATP-binding protein